MQIETILNQIDLGSYALPEFQRGYVWNRDQVKRLMNSLYHDYPIGGLLVWVTSTNQDLARGDVNLTPGSVNLILDGQQRITSLYGIIKGIPPKFFDGNARSFTGLYFNLKEESFEFYMPTKMKDNPEWISVTELMQKGVGIYLQDATNDSPERGQYLMTELSKLTKIDNIKKVDLHIQQVAGDNFTIDVVVDIFNNVNSGGTKLSKGDLALAKICGEWSNARGELKRIIKKFSRAGYNFQMEWLLRCITVCLTKRPYFSELDKVSISEFRKALSETEGLIGECLDHIGSRLGLDNDRVLGGRYAIPTMVGYLKIRGANKLDNNEWDKLLYWYIHSFLWGRYTGSTESVMAQDLNAISNGGDVESLISLMRQSRGDLTIRPEDFRAWSTGARIYPLLYMLTRVSHAKDFGSGVELSNAMLGKNSSLEVHHIFPKHLLYEKGYSKNLVNQIANYAFLTKKTNLEISDRDPAEYIPEYNTKTPGAIESHWIPKEKEYWALDRYDDFLEKRRDLLAEGANSFLDSLYKGTIESVQIETYSDRDVSGEADSMTVEEERIIDDVNKWMEEQGLQMGIKNYELVDQNGEVLATIDLAWPQGVQTGLSKPIALLIDEDETVHTIVNQQGYTFFTDDESLKKNINDEYAFE